MILIILLYVRSFRCTGVTHLAVSSKTNKRLSIRLTSSHVPGEIGLHLWLDVVMSPGCHRAPAFLSPFCLLSLSAGSSVSIHIVAEWLQQPHVLHPLTFTFQKGNLMLFPELLAKSHCSDWLSDPSPSQSQWSGVGMQHSDDMLGTPARSAQEPMG